MQKTTSFIWHEYESRTFGSAPYGNYWHALWIYFIAPPVVMLAAGEIFFWPGMAKNPVARSWTTKMTSAVSSATPDRSRGARASHYA
jgi:hypothetical protein